MIKNKTITVNVLAKYAALAAILAAFFGYYCTPIWDMDFWWHIANGRHIVATHTVPGHDPFGVYDTTGPRSDVILKTYWLAQIAYYVTFEQWGAGGIIFLKAGMLTLCLAVIFARSALLGAGGISSLLALSIAGMTLLDFTGERTQLFSFVFFSAAMLALDYSCEKKTVWPLYLLPPLMLLWANCHAGVTLGGVTLGLLALAYAAEWRWSGNSPYAGKWIFPILAAAVLCTLISPNGAGSYLYLLGSQFSEGELRDRTSEYASPVAMWREMGKTLPFYWGFILLAIAALPKAIRRPHVAPLLLILFLGGLSLSAFRYIPFFLLYAAPYLALGLTRQTAAARLPVIPAYGALLAAALFALGYGARHDKAFQSGIQANRFPQGATAFMQNNKLTGKVFNAYAWGGYLTWHLHPRVKIFIDGRALDLKRFQDYTHILWATPYGLQQLEQNRFDFVMIPYANNFTGEQYKLNGYLLQDSRWRIAYRDQAGYLFARESDALR